MLTSADGRFFDNQMDQKSANGMLFTFQIIDKKLSNLKKKVNVKGKNIVNN